MRNCPTCGLHFDGVDCPECGPTEPPPFAPPTSSRPLPEVRRRRPERPAPIAILVTVAIVLAVGLIVVFVIATSSRYTPGGKPPSDPRKRAVLKLCEDIYVESIETGNFEVVGWRRVVEDGREIIILRSRSYGRLSIDGYSIVNGKARLVLQEPAALHYWDAADDF